MPTGPARVYRWRRRLSGARCRRRARGGARAALGAGAGLWLGLLLVGLVAPGGRVWGMAEPLGNIENDMIALWFVALVLAASARLRSAAGGQRPLARFGDRREATVAGIVRRSTEAAR